MKTCMVTSLKDAGQNVLLSSFFIFFNWRSCVSVFGCRRSIRRSSLLISVTAMPRSARWTASPLLVMVLWSRLVSSDLVVWRLWTKCSECQNQWFLFSLVIPQCEKETPWVKEFQCYFLSRNGCGSKKMIILYSLSKDSNIAPSASFFPFCVFLYFI